MAFNTQDELCKTVENLIFLIEKSGHVQSAQVLRESYRSVNGLTDGWADFLESIKKVQKEREIKIEDRNVFKEIHDAAYFAVYRRKPSQWWKFW